MLAAGPIGSFERFSVCVWLEPLVSSPSALLRGCRCCVTDDFELVDFLSATDFRVDDLFCCAADLRVDFLEFVVSYGDTRVHGGMIATIFFAAVLKLLEAKAEVSTGVLGIDNEHPGCFSDEILAAKSFEAVVDIDVKADFGDLKLFPVFRQPFASSDAAGVIKFLGSIGTVVVVESGIKPTQSFVEYIDESQRPELEETGSESYVGVSLVACCRLL